MKLKKSVKKWKGQGQVGGEQQGLSDQKREVGKRRLTKEGGKISTDEGGQNIK